MARIPKTNIGKVLYYSPIVLVISAYVLFLILFGSLDSILLWALRIILATVFSTFCYFAFTRLKLGHKQYLAFALLCILLTLPFFTISGVIGTQKAAQNVSTPKEMEYFRNLLGRSYNYTELITWENQHLNFSYEDITRNNDPIKIYEYGKGRCEEFAILYSELCVSQGYQCRIVASIFNDHVFNEVKLNGTWTRVDSS